MVEKDSAYQSPFLCPFGMHKNLALSGMQEIGKWLSGDRDYEEGRLLYERYGSNDFLKKIFLSGNTPFNIMKLATSLEELAPAMPTNLPELIPVISKSVGTSQSEAAKSSDDFSRFLRLKKERDDIVRQLDRSMAMLDMLEDQEPLFLTAREIIKLNDRKENSWALIDYYDANKCFPDDHPNQDTEEVKSREKKMQSIYECLCRARKRLANPNCKTPEKTRALIEKKIKELEEIKKSYDTAASEYS